MNITVDQVIRDYRIMSYLGKGGMGEVWLAEDIQIKREVALKFLFPGIATDQAFVERFRLEAQIQGSLKHPNILGIHSFFPHEDTHVLCMEKAEGQTLKDIISQVGLLPVERALMIMRQCLDVLDFIHAKGIIHRDIKPSNIMVDRVRNDMVKVMDFGVAKGPESGQLTKTGTTVGSPFYMSPEQVCNTKVDHRSDFFSLGITFYEMITGHQPFLCETGSEYKIGKLIVEQPLPDPRQHYPFIPDWIVDIINKMCYKDPVSRYQNARQIIEDIEFNKTTITSTKTPEPVVRPVSKPKQGAVKKPVMIVLGIIVIISVILLASGLMRKDKDSTITQLETAEPALAESLTEATEFTPEQQPRDPQTEINALLDRWLAAWKAKDLDSYMACYDSDRFLGFVVSKTGKRQLTYQEWLQDKQKKFAQAGTIQVDISNLSIREINPDYHEATFRQVYKSRVYTDSGLKSLRLVKVGQQWLIYYEDFKLD